MESYPAQGGEEEEEEKVGEHHDEELQKYNKEEPALLDAEEDEVLPIDIEEADKEELEEYFDEEEGYDEEPLTDEEELVDEEYEDYGTLPFGEDMINPFGYHERLTDLEKCFMHNYNTFYHDDNGSPVSNIPVTEENFNEGFFVQDVTEESCAALDENGKSTNPSCFQAGSSTYCESCIFNVTMFKATFGNSYEGFHPCRNEVSSSCHTSFSLISRSIVLEESLIPLSVPTIFVPRSRSLLRSAKRLIASKCDQPLSKYLIYSRLVVVSHLI